MSTTYLSVYQEVTTQQSIHYKLCMSRNPEMSNYVGTAQEFNNKVAGTVKHSRFTTVPIRMGRKYDLARIHRCASSVKKAKEIEMITQSQPYAQSTTYMILRTISDEGKYFPDNMRVIITFSNTIPETFQEHELSGTMVDVVCTEEFQVKETVVKVEEDIIYIL